VESLHRGQAHFFEPGLNDLLTKLVQAGRISFATRIPEDWRGSTYVVTVGTPLDRNGRVRLDMIENVSREIARHLRADDLIVMRSTVKPGTTRGVVMPVLDTAGVSYDIAFCPERTLEGQALKELRELPQIVGGISPAARVRAAQLFSFITATVVQVSTLEAAEMIKLIDNTQRDVWFAFANEVAGMCDALGIGVMEVANAGKLGYPRSNLARPGPVGGPCLEKDSYILAEKLTEFGLEPAITLAARRLNEAQPRASAERMKSFTGSLPGFPAKPVVALLGLAFKGRPATDDLRGTMALPILAHLRASFPQATFRGFDPVVAPAAIADTFAIAPAGSLEDAFRGAHLVVIANNHATFADMQIEVLAGTMARPALLYDFWNNFDPKELTLPDGVRYMGLGTPPQTAAQWPEAAE
jgi:UDP-N-acetyl-D-mannosaminuronic acid dehydrogenase